MSRLNSLVILVLLAISCSPKRQTVIIDEQVSSKFELLKLDSSEIFKSSYWSLGTAPPEYEVYNTDLIVVTTWKYERQLQKERHTYINHLIKLVEQGEDILIMFNGVEVTNDKLDMLKTIEPRELSSVDTLKLVTAEQIFKEKARSKNVIINTYDLKTDLVDIK